MIIQHLKKQLNYSLHYYTRVITFPQNYDSKFKLKFDQQWIHSYICPNKENEFFKRCNYAINWFLDNCPIVEEDMYCILNDDDGYEPEFFNKISNYSKSNL